MTSLSFSVPPDSGALRVRLTGPDRRVHDWTATAFEPTHRLDGLVAGAYEAILEPLGQPPVTYAFELDPSGGAIETPSLTELRSTSARFASVKEPGVLEFLKKETLADGGLLTSAAKADELKDALSAASASRSFTLGLSENVPYRRGNWRPYAGSAARIEPTSSGVDVVIDEADSPEEPARLRISLALGGGAVERFLVPRYRRGVRVSFRASSLTTMDVIVKVLPEDPERRALVQALEAGSTTEAKALSAGLQKSPLYAELLDPNRAIGDPWSTVVFGLLTERFGEFRDLTEPSWPQLAKAVGWIADIHVLAARQILRDVGLGRTDRRAAADQALDALAESRRTGAPYFVQTSNLMGEMLAALAEGAPTALQRQRATQEQARWRRGLVLRGNLGATFSWLVAGRSSPSDEKKSPDRLFAPKGRGLQARYAAILFQGEVALAQIRPASPPQASRAQDLPKVALKAETAAGSAIPRPPGLKRPVRRKDDPNWHRFGGRAERSGFALGVRFGATRGRWVDITLTVDAPRGAVAPYSDVVEFYLHDSFEPDRYRVTFRGERASLPVASWGGFTVGAWLPRQGIELELDLAEVTGAPLRIQKY